MRYDGPAGLMLDLIGASPDGVDMEWIHPYTYANNNPVRFTDPSGLRFSPEDECNGKMCFGTPVKWSDTGNPWSPVCGKRELKCQREHENWPLCNGESDPEKIAKKFLRDGYPDVNGLVLKECHKINFPNLPGCQPQGGQQYHCSVTVNGKKIPNQVSVACCNCCDSNGDEGHDCTRPHWARTPGRPIL